MHNGFDYTVKITLEVNGDLLTQQTLQNRDMNPVVRSGIRDMAEACSSSFFSLFLFLFFDLLVLATC